MHYAPVSFDTYTMDPWELVEHPFEDDKIGGKAGWLRWSASILVDGSMKGILPD